MADLALVLELLEGAEAFLERGAGVNAVELVEIDAIEFKAAQAHATHCLR